MWKWDDFFGTGTNSTVKVVGFASTDESNDVATINVYVNGLNSDKNTAVNEMSTKASALIEYVKEFGVAAEDIKTVNQSVYQDSWWNDNTGRSELGDWRASTGVEIRVRDLSRVNELTSLLLSQDISSLDGPYFGLDTVASQADTELLSKALEDARTKAEAIAKAGNRRLGKMISFEESGAYSPDYPILYDRAMSGGGGSYVEPGTSVNSKSVVVIYQLK